MRLLRRSAPAVLAALLLAPGTAPVAASGHDALRSNVASFAVAVARNATAIAASKGASLVTPEDLDIAGRETGSNGTIVYDAATDSVVGKSATHTCRSTLTVSTTRLDVRVGRVICTDGAREALRAWNAALSALKAEKRADEKELKSLRKDAITTLKQQYRDTVITLNNRRASKEEKAAAKAEYTITLKKIEDIYKEVMAEIAKKYLEHVEALGPRPASGERR
jgi:histone H3/H4